MKRSRAGAVMMALRPVPLNALVALSGVFRAARMAAAASASAAV